MEKEKHCLTVVEQLNALKEAKVKALDNEKHVLLSNETPVLK